ncbi:Metal-dependent hydrolase [Rhodovastum atsumiense]|nr:metal-dependent hydrolase [Rhodovastum atsumiense]CAH2604313.1 Metal-dependent hydrolase [Rhodovastum atsumiense]
MVGSHVALGAASWLVVAPHLGQPAVGLVPLGLAVIGALLPDIDHPKSWVGQRARPLSTVCAMLLGHRGITHSLFAVAVCTWLLVEHGFSEATVAPLVVGYLSHLGGDLLTPRGLRLAWPLKGTWALPICRTGSASEPLVVMVALCCAIVATVGLDRVQATVRATGLCRLVPDLPAICQALGGPPSKAQACPPPAAVERQRARVAAPPPARPRPPTRAAGSEPRPATAG